MGGLFVLAVVAIWAPVILTAVFRVRREMRRYR